EIVDTLNIHAHGSGQAPVTFREAGVLERAADRGLRGAGADEAVLDVERELVGVALVEGAGEVTLPRPDPAAAPVGNAVGDGVRVAVVEALVGEQPVVRQPGRGRELADEALRVERGRPARVVRRGAVAARLTGLEVFRFAVVRQALDLAVE